MQSLDLSMMWPACQQVKAKQASAGAADSKGTGDLLPVLIRGTPCQQQPAMEATVLVAEKKHAAMISMRMC